MEKIIVYKPEFENQIQMIVDILFEKEYFGFLESAKDYREKIYDLDFENIELYGVSGNVIRTSDNKYSLRLNIVDPATKKIVEEDFPYPTSGNLPRSNVMEALNGLNDSIIYSLIHGRMPTQKELSDLAKASKTP